jgi:hypothetical protein
MPDGNDGLRGKKTERDAPFTPRLARFRSPEAPRIAAIQRAGEDENGNERRTPRITKSHIRLVLEDVISCGVANS